MKFICVLLTVLASLIFVLTGCATPDSSSSSMSSSVVVGKYSGWDGAPGSKPLAQSSFGTLTLLKNGAYVQQLSYGGQTHVARGQWHLSEEGWDGHCVVLSNAWLIDGGIPKQRPEVSLSVSKDTNSVFLALPNRSTLSYLKDNAKQVSGKSAGK